MGMPTSDTVAMVVRRTAAALAVIVVGTYVIAILVLTGPTNALSIRAQGVTHAVMRPHLDQNWRLFAPTPVSDERGLLMRAWRAGEDAPTAWVDITSPAIASSRALGPFSPRTARVISSGLQMYFQPSPLQLLALEQAQRRGEPAPDHDDEELSPAQQRYMQRALDLLHRFAAHEAHSRWPRDVTEVQIRIVVHEFPSFSERARWDELGEVRTIDLERRAVGDA